MPDFTLLSQARLGMSQHKEHGAEFPGDRAARRFGNRPDRILCQRRLFGCLAFFWLAIPLLAEQALPQADQAQISLRRTAPTAPGLENALPAMPETGPRPKRQLMELAEGFSPSAQFASRTKPLSEVVNAATTATTPPGEIRQVSLEEPVPEQTIDESTETPAPLPEDAFLDKPLHLSKSDGTEKLGKPKFTAAVAPLVTTLGSLLMVLAAFFFLVLIFKKVTPKGNRLLPKEVFEDLGRTCLTQKLQLHLLRLGNRLILVSITPDGVSPITEITDPDEVVPILGMCRRLDTNSSSELFRKTLANFSGKDDEKSGYFGVGTSSKTEARAKTSSKDTPKSSLDLYSEPGESLAEILASALPGKGAQHG